MAALLAAEAGAGDLHPLEDVLVADRRPDDAARRPPRPPPAARRCDRTDTTRRAARRARRGRAGRARARRGPGRRRRPGRPRRPRRSRSASPSSANPTSAPRAATARASEAGVGRPALDVDVHAVGLVVDDLDRRAGRGEDLRPDHAAGAVRAVEHDPQPAGVDRRARAPAGGRGSGRAGRGVDDRPTELGVRRRQPSSSVRQISCSSSSSTASSSLRPAAVEDLEAVVLGRVVRRRDHDPGRERRPSRRGTRGPASGRTPTWWTSTPRLVAPAVIAATNMSPERRVSWPTTIAPPGPDELVGRRPAERVGDRRLQVDVGDAADPVGAEEAGHATARPRGSGRRPR